MAQLKLGVLASGNGSNLQAIVDAIASGELDASVCIVICNEPGARALERATQAGIPAVCVPHRDYLDRAAFDQRVGDLLQGAGVQWVVLAGFMRVLTSGFLRRFSHRVLNIHPALLPAFPGVRAIRQALDAGVKVTGCTVHLVDDGIDSGPILGQTAVAIAPDDDEESLATRVHAAEHRLYVDVLRQLSQCDLVLSAGASGSMLATLRPR